MPGAADETAAAGSDKKPPAESADRVGEELADDASIWRIYDKIAKEDDERRTKSWDNGLNNLALFAGLFSAVTTTFIIEARQDLEPDYAQLTFLVLNATSFGERFVHQQFSIPPSARTVNCLWVASLILSLSAALIAIMGKDWIGMYSARPLCNLRQWAEMRSYRLRCVERWYMSGVIASAPVLLHVSLLLFGAGLVLFISSDPLTHHLILGLSLAAGVLYLVTTFSAVVFSTSPFKSPATQLIRAALSSLFSYVLSIFYRPKRNLVHTLLRNINAMVLPHAADATSLPLCSPEIRQSHARRQPAAFLSAALRGAAIAYVRNIATAVRMARRSLRWSRVRSQLGSVASAVRHSPLRDWFLASTWTDLPTDRRPDLLADALSWLSGASQAPEVFRAIVFALGDLDIGPHVGRHTSIALRTRLRAEIRRTWQQVDLLILSRYALADQNLTGDAALDIRQFLTRVDQLKESALCHEAGLAARVKLLPGHIFSSELADYLPASYHVTQPRMLEFLVPLIQQMHTVDATEALILVCHRYRAHLRMHGVFNLNNIEAHLHQSLDIATREAYAVEVNVKYGGTAGAVELLTFLCCHCQIDQITQTAAVELIMELLKREYPNCEHRCIAYLFGSSGLREVAWPDKKWSSGSLYCLSLCLDNSRRRPFQPSSARTLSDDHHFDLALARTTVLLLSPKHDAFAWLSAAQERKSIAFLSGYLCQPPSPSNLDNDGKLNVIHLILETAALLRIVGMPEYFNYNDNTVNCGAAILAAIISESCRLLRNDATISEGERLFQALAFAKVKEANGETLTWDLGEWLRTQTPIVLERCPSSATGMQGIHNALVEIYPLCVVNSELRAHWDRIDYPGRAGDIFSDPFLDVGAFFENAEAPRTRPRDIFDDPEWVDLATEFFDGAEERGYHWRPDNME